MKSKLLRHVSGIVFSLSKIIVVLTIVFVKVDTINRAGSFSLNCTINFHGSVGREGAEWRAETTLSLSPRLKFPNVDTGLRNGL